MDVEFIERVQRSFGHLLKSRRFELVYEGYWPRAFGNAVLEYSTDKLGLKISRDRGQDLVFLSAPYLGSLGPREHDRVLAETIFESLGVIGCEELQNSAKAIDANYDRLCQYFSDADSIESLKLDIQRHFKEHPREFDYNL